MTDFVHLHLHTEYSLLDGACRIHEMMGRVKELGQKAVAITDHGVMYGVIDFYRAAKAAGIKPIIGCEVYLAPGSRFDKEPGSDNRASHLVLLAENETGYKNLIYIVSAGFTEGFYVKPRVDLELLRERHEGIIASSACISGPISRKILEQDIAGAKEMTQTLAGIFGAEHFYLELQDHHQPEQIEVNRAILRIAAETGLPLIATNDVHYLNREDAYVQEVLMCIQTNHTMDDPDRMHFDSPDFYLKSGDEMAELFAAHPEAIENTCKVAERCNVEFEFGHYHLPDFPLPEGTDHFEYLRELTWRGFEKKIKNPTQEYKDRIEYELDMIRRMGFVDFFLITQDFINYAKRHDIPVGPGRGSAAGSMVAYCLNITEVDSIHYACYFERFINLERVTMPDIDVDFCYVRRQEVIDYVIRKYGSDRVSQIVTFGTMQARGAIRDVARALNIPYAEADSIAKLVPNELKMTLKHALEVSPQLKTRYDVEENTRKLIDTAMKLEGMPRHASTHAAGMLVTAKPVYEYVPMAKNDEAIVTQFGMTTLEELGLLKVDFLGLRNVTVIHDAEKMIRRYQPDFNIKSVPMDDKETYAMLCEGKTQGVFQIESGGMISVIIALQPQSIEDISAVIALYRPGPMDSIPRYIENRHHPDAISYLHPQLKDILEVTYGCIVYQEQVMEIFRKLAGYSLGRADIVRRAMSKKKYSVLEQERVNFIQGNEELHIDGAVARGIDEESANRIFDEMQEFANYAFNKAHTVCYAIICYQTAYLKCHYPKEYMAALLTSVLDSTQKVTGYIAECKAMGIPVLPPDINESGADFTVSGDSIRFGLVAVKNVGRAFIRNMVAERESNGPFLTFKSFCDRMYHYDLNRRMVESLIKCGAFDSLHLGRASLLAGADRVMEAVADENRKNIAGQMSLFDLMDDHPTEHEAALPDVPEFPASELLRMEKETTGLYLSGHPMEEYRNIVQRLHAAPLGEIIEAFSGDNSQEMQVRYADGQIVTIAGIVTAVRTKTTKNNTVMAYVTVEDLTGSIEMLVFAKLLQKAEQVLQEGNAVAVSGRLSGKEGEAPKLVCDELGILTERPEMLTASDYPRHSRDTEEYGAQNPYERHAATEIPTGLPEEIVRAKKLYLRFNTENTQYSGRCLALLRVFRGDVPVVLFDAATREARDAGQNQYVMKDAVLNDALRKLLGNENVVWK